MPSILRLALVLLFCMSFNNLNLFAKKVPTLSGTYKMKGKRLKSDGQIWGPYSGEIQVKALNDSLIVMSFFVTKGAPSFNSGSFVDTLIVVNKEATYTNSELDASCKIHFKFASKAIQVTQDTTDHNAGCGFGYGIVADGYFKKTSSKIPTIRHPLTGEIQ